MSSSHEYILETRALTKEFKGFVAVDKVDLRVKRGGQFRGQMPQDGLEAFPIQQAALGLPRLPMFFDGDQPVPDAVGKGPFLNFSNQRLKRLQFPILVQIQNISCSPSGCFKQFLLPP